jgi:hypothetical protein
MLTLPAKKNGSTMEVIGVAAGVIVAGGTIAAGISWLVKWIFGRGRKAEREHAERDRLAADLKELRTRLLDQ